MLELRYNHTCVIYIDYRLLPLLRGSMFGACGQRETIVKGFVCGNGWVGKGRLDKQDLKLLTEMVKRN